MALRTPDEHVTSLKDNRTICYRGEKNDDIASDGRGGPTPRIGIIGTLSLKRGLSANLSDWSQDHGLWPLFDVRTVALGDHIRDSHSVLRSTFTGRCLSHTAREFTSRSVNAK